VNLPRHSRRWAVAGALVALCASAWLLFVPLTAIYVSSAERPGPGGVSSRYSWWATEQNLLYSDSGLGPQAHGVNGVRLNCGNAFTTGLKENAHRPDGPQACAQIEAPRVIVALLLFTLGLLALAAIRRLPASTRPEPGRYRRPYNQRRTQRRFG
jgi:hypothetical protein